ncbi:unnamed protein product [Vitrella brassicaformis CCMP3155]|uniref:PH domain-containing protein n=2 Tax=Vitrella brassicaformis TaxID=1169539 RepID=A0A0G4EVA3_VITBC|nr:unnamed protein product [Vitrella brassicaformis CCMP3155]|eukprot:CEM02273.1 unnamed protein product [Vitrella brassicaformis CCMP3155]
MAVAAPAEGPIKEVLSAVFESTDGEASPYYTAESVEFTARSRPPSPTAVEGWLQKRPATFIGGWQDRYFKLIEGGRQLGYWRKVPRAGVSIELDPPKGIINLMAVSSIHIEDATKFTLLSPGRDWFLKAHTAAEKDAWVEALEAKMRLFHADRAVEEEEKKERFVEMLGGSSRYRAYKARPHQVAARPDSANTDAKRQFLKLKGLWEPLQMAWEASRAESRPAASSAEGEQPPAEEEGPAGASDEEGFLESVLFGQLKKNRRDTIIAQDPSSAQYATSYYFVVIASRPIITLRATQPLPINRHIAETTFPLGVQADTLYYFAAEMDGSCPKGAIDLRSCIDISDVISRAEGFEVRLHSGDYLRGILADTQQEATVWRDALRASRKAAEALDQGRDMTVREQLQVFDRTPADERKRAADAAIKIKLARLFVWAVAEERGTSPKTLADTTSFPALSQLLASHATDIPIDKLLVLLEDFSNECGALLQAATSVRPPRKDVCAFIVEQYLRPILVGLADFWTAAVRHDVERQGEVDIGDLRNTMAMPPAKVFSILEFLHVLSTGYEEYGVFDLCYPAAIEALAEAYARRVLANTVPLVFNLVKQETIFCPIRHAIENWIYTSAPVDLFHLVTTYLAQARDARIRVLSEKVLEITKAVVFHYQVTLRELLLAEGGVEGYLRLDFLAAQLNNTSLFIEKCAATDRYMGLNYETEQPDTAAASSSTLGGGMMDADDRVASLSLREEARRFAALASIVEELLAIRLLNNAAVLLRRKNVIDMPVRHVTIQLLASSLERLQEDLQWVFVQRIAAQLLHHILVIYLKGLIKYPVPRPDRPRLVTKIRNDYGVLGEFFESFLGEAATKRRVAILQDMSDVLQERPDFLTFKVCEFRRKYGPFFDMYVVTQLVALRDDINKMEKDEVLSSCQEALSSINEEEGAPPEPDTAASSPTGGLLRFVPLTGPRSPDASTQPSRTPTRGPQDAESRRQLRSDGGRERLPSITGSVFEELHWTKVATLRRHSGRMWEERETRGGRQSAGRSKTVAVPRKGHVTPPLPPPAAEPDIGEQREERLTERQESTDSLPPGESDSQVHNLDWFLSARDVSPHPALIRTPYPSPSTPTEASRRRAAALTRPGGESPTPDPCPTPSFGGTARERGSIGEMSTRDGSRPSVSVTGSSPVSRGGESTEEIEMQKLSSSFEGVDIEEEYIMAESTLPVVVCEGHLYKKDFEKRGLADVAKSQALAVTSGPDLRHLNQSWQLHWCAIKNGRLYWYPSRDNPISQGSVDLKFVTDVRLPDPEDDPQHLRFQLLQRAGPTLPPRVYDFHAPTMQHRQVWLDAFHAVQGKMADTQEDDIDEDDQHTVRLYEAPATSILFLDPFEPPLIANVKRDILGANWGRSSKVVAADEDEDSEDDFETGYRDELCVCCPWCQRICRRLKRRLSRLGTGEGRAMGSDDRQSARLVE